MSLTRGRNISSQPRQQRSTQGGSTRSIGGNNEHQELNTLNNELRGENTNEVSRSSNKTRGPNRGTPMPADRSQRIEISIENDK